MNIDPAIVNLNIPNMDGFELIETIRESEDYGELPVIILSSEGGKESKDRGKDVGADTYLEKPFDSKMIQYQVSKLLND